MTKVFIKMKKTVMRITSLLYPEPAPPFKDALKVSSHKITTKDVVILTDLMESDLVENGFEGNEALQYFRSNKLN